MSLHYLVKVEMLIARTLQVSCYRKKLQNLSHLNCALQIGQIWIQSIPTCVKYCKRRCAKHASLIWRYQPHHWQMAAAMTTRSSLAHSVLSCCFSSFRSVMRVLYTFSCNIPTRCNQPDSNLANFGPQLRWNKFWSFFL